MSEISCTKCISPNTSFDLVQEYSLKKSFFDIEKTNRYYYCIADAEDK
ncbi:MAG: hypothetical protein LBQ24_05830 [Candidatus Peribacteria bacterium]|nr:hypothetical protein [Candidatus Peribacteria bacterium]